MKKILLCAIMALLSVMNAAAYTDEQGVVYELDEDAQTYAVTGHTRDLKSEIVIASEVDGVPVASIGDYTFYGCSGLTSVTIPNSVTSIGVGAFYKCTGLTSVSIPNSVTSIGRHAFEDCSGLTSITIPNSVTSIGDDAFRGCTGLTSITIPNSVTSIGYLAFYGCSSLPVIDNIRYADTYLIEAVDKTLTTYNIKEGTRFIGYDAFGYCENLTSVTIPESVTSIDSYAFYGCSGLISVTIGKNVSSIGSYAFSGCKLDTVIVFCEEPIEISYSTFDDDTKENAILCVPYGCKRAHSWWRFKKITYITDSSDYIDEQGVIYAHLDNTEDYAAVGYTDALKENVVVLSEVNGVPVTSIGRCAFEDCENLNSVTIPNSVTTIGYEAFYYCTGLTTITIPESVTYIGEGAFSRCSALNFVIVQSHEPIEIDDFGTYYATLFVPAGCKQAYAEAEGWNQFEKIIDSYVIDEQGIIYVHEDDSQNYYVAGLTDALKNEIVIASEVDGVPVTSIGESAFESNKSITSVTIPNSVISIGEDAFRYCSGLTSITIPNSVTSIGEYAFYACSSLPIIDNIRYADTYLIEAVDKTPTTYNIKEGTRFIGSSAFQDCRGLTSIDIPNSVTSIGNHAFYKCTGLTSVSIPNSVTSIGRHAFEDCSGLTSIIIPNSVTSIGSYAFYGCSGLTSIIIPNSVTSIGDCTFYGCSGLISVTIGKNVSSIGTYAFRGCKLDTVIVLREEPIDISWSSVFNDDTKENAILCVPYGCKSAYSWWRFKKITYITDPSDYIDEQGVIYAHLDNTEAYAAVGYTDALKENVVVLAEVNGVPVTSIGRCAFEDCENLNSVTIPNSVTTIGYEAFYYCTGLTAITIPESVTYIGEGAFSRCSALNFVIVQSHEPIEIDDFGEYYATLFVPAGCKQAYAEAEGWNQFEKIIDSYVIDEQGIIYALEDDSQNYYVAGHTDALKNEIVIASEVDGVPVTSIGESAFESNKSITSVTIPNSVISIGEDAFRYCSGLTSITIPNSVTSIGEDAFSGCSGLPIIDNIRYADTYLIKAVDKTLTTYNIKEETRFIGNDAFEYCENLTSITIPNSVISIGDYAFSGCFSLPVIDNIRYADTYLIQAIDETLTTYNIKEGTRFIGGNAFSGCENLISITIPQSVISIGRGVLSYCSNLTSIVVESGNLMYDSRNSCNAIIETSSNTLIAGCQNTTIPNTVTSISERAFRGCIGLASIAIPNSVKSIGYEAFDDCENLTSVTIPNSVTSIGQYAFGWCELNTIIVLREEPIGIVDDVFEPDYWGDDYYDIYENATLYVPYGCKQAYAEAEGWKNFTHIEEMEPSSILDFSFDKNENAPIYDLNGKRLNARSKGINIIRGKKVLVE